MTPESVKSILGKIQRIKVAVLGDFCLDIYWKLDPRGSEISIETHLPARAVVQQNVYPGGAANVAANVAALRPETIKAIGTIGYDSHAEKLKEVLRQKKIDISRLVVQEKKFQTYAFYKPYLRGKELERLDFGVFNRRSAHTDRSLLRALQQAFSDNDAVIYNQQIASSVPTSGFIDAVNAMIAEFSPKVFFSDSRHLSQPFCGGFVKLDEAELSKKGQSSAGSPPARGADAMAMYASSIYQKSNRPVFITLGARGIAVYDETGLTLVPAVPLSPPLDPVGAGDTTVSALTCALAAGANPFEAAEFANLAAAVTVQKLRQTGTASAKEILDIANLQIDPRQDPINQ